MRRERGDAVKITLEPTTKLVELKTSTGTVPARIWEGKTDSGIPVHAYLTRIAAPLTADLEQFERELKETRAPSPEVEAIPLRLIL
jgi:hypothetical protein